MVARQIPPKAPLSPTEPSQRFHNLIEKLQGSILTKTALLVKRDHRLFDLRKFTCSKGGLGQGHRKWSPTRIAEGRARYVYSFCGCLAKDKG